MTRPRSILAVCALLVAVGSARAGTPVVGGLLPVGGTRGVPVTVTFVGDRLADPLEVMVYEPGIAVSGLVAESPRRVKATFTVAPDCPLGEHAFRLRTKSGVSDLRTFWVGTLPVVAEVEPNTEFDKAQAVPLNSTVTGVVDREDVDYFVVDCKKGQRLSVEVEGMRLGQQFWDPAVAILDSRRFELAASDDAAGLGQDAGCSVVIPADGKYTVRLRESSYQGSGGCHYRLHVGHFPRPTAIIPCGGKPGETIDVRFLGDAQGEIRQQVKLPPTPGEFRFRLQTAEGVHPGGVLFRVSDLPAVSDTPAGAKPEGAAVGTAPGAFHGVLAKPSEERYFRFPAKKGQGFAVATYARKLGSPLDSVVSIHRSDKGKLGGQVAANDDSNNSPDSAFTFQVPDDGDYFLRVADHLGQGGADYFFRVELAAPKAETVTTIPKVDGNNVTNQDRQSIVVPQGGRYAALINTNRANWGGPLTVGLSKLPAGVTVTSDPVAADLGQVPVVFEATPTAPLAGVLADVKATPTDPKTVVPSRTDLDVRFCIGVNNTPFHTYHGEAVAVAVAEPAPYSIEVVEPRVPVPQNGSMNLKVVAKRAVGFAGPVTLYPLWTPPGMGIQAGVVIAPDKTEALVSLNAAPNAQAKAWRTALIAVGDAGKGPVYVSSQLFKLSVSPPLVTLAQNRAAVDQGQSTQIECKVEFPAPLVGKATVKLLGLPAKASTADKPLAPETKDIVFDVRTAKETPAGKHNVFCQVIVERDGETVTQNAGGGELRVDVPLPPKVQPAASPQKPTEKPKPKPTEKRLSRLEQLRQEQEAREKSEKPPEPKK